MTTINANRYNRGGRMVMLLLSVVFQYVLIKYGLSKQGGNIGIWLLYGVTFIFWYLAIIAVVSFFGVTRIQIDETGGMIKLIRLFSKHTVSTKNIVGYYDTFSDNRPNRSYAGIIIILKDKKTFCLDQHNLNQVQKVKTLLDESRVPCLGKKMAWFPFKPKV